MYQVNNIKSYQKFVSRYKDMRVFYRGQEKTYPKIESSVARNTGFLDNESTLFSEIKTLVPLEFTNIKTPLEYLAIMQHFSIPTRLIDVTVNPLIALFFAVENVNERESAIIYVYKDPSFDANSKSVNLLSLLALQKKYDFDSIMNEYSRYYSNSITKEEILSLSCKSCFINYSEEFSKLNKRIANQNGTFFICGNCIQNDTIHHQLHSLDEIKPLTEIAIPFEYKEAIKIELEREYHIFPTSIYPDLPTAAQYLRVKYGSSRPLFTPEGKFVIVNEGTPNIERRKIFVKAHLSQQLTIDETKQVAKYITKQKSIEYDHIRVDIAKTDKDIVSHNWLLQSEWVKPGFNPGIIQFSKYQKDEEGYFWQCDNQFLIMEKFNDEYFFDKDNDLYIYHKKIYDKVSSIFCQISNLYFKYPLDYFIENVKSFEKEIGNAFMVLNEFGHSKNSEFDKFLDLFLSFVTPLEGIFQLIRMNNADSNLSRLIGYEIKSAKRKSEEIEADFQKWEKALNITPDEFNRVEPNQYTKKKYTYEPTLPISPNAISIEIKPSVEILEDSTIIINGKTNLFEDAELLVSIHGLSIKYGGQAKCMVKNGVFRCGPFGSKGGGICLGTYRGSISLSSPSTQMESFVKKAGIEYEKIGGPLVKRYGISPMLEYEWIFTIT